MNTDLKMKLMKEIESELIDLESLEAGSEEYEKTVESINKLSKLVIDMDSKASEETIKEIELNGRKKERMINMGLGIAGVALTGIQILQYGICYMKGLKFEETGTIGSFFNRNLLNGMFKFKK